MRMRVAVPDAHVSPAVIDAALEAVTRLDESMIRSGDSPTSHQAIAAGAVWRPEPYGEEHFDHGAEIAARGWGDCDDWAPLHAATLRADGTDPGAVARVVPSGPDLYHAIVQRSDGSIEDPSVSAGMKAKRVGGVDDVSIHIIAHDPHDGRIYEGSLFPATSPLSARPGPAMAVRPVAQGLYQARCDLPIVGSSLVHVRRVDTYQPRVKRIGFVPYAWSSTELGPHPAAALVGAILGAILCGDASESSAVIDRLKCIAAQALLCGMHESQVIAALAMHVPQGTPDPMALAAAVVHAVQAPLTEIVGRCRGA